ncbi:MAG: hypothetical protein WBK91_02310 [Alphaproteobacteria bacterium]
MFSLTKKLITLSIILFACTAHATEEGMYLCKTPEIAGKLWQAANHASSLGIRLKKDVLDDIATKFSCNYEVSPSMKPVSYESDILEIKDGKIKGWVHIQFYIFYVNHSAR